MSIAKSSKYRPLFDEFLSEKFILAISNEVVSEYIEVIEIRTNSSIASNLAELITSKSNVKKTDVHFRWNLISADFDDNKFTDLYIASNADYLVTNDAHFIEASQSAFPTINIIGLDDFLELIVDYQSQ